MSYHSDPALVEACLSGDRAAWERLVDRYARLVWSITRKHGLPEADAEDVHQTTFATLIHHLANLRSREKLSSWIITTATRECWRTRKRAARQPFALADDIDAPGDGDSPALERQLEEHQLVREGFERLTDRCRELLTVLFAAVGEPHYPTIAEQLGLPVGSIGPTRARCLAKLESILRSLGIGED